MWLLFLVQFSLYVTSFSATIQYVEICPEIKPMIGFELTKWVEGTWYQLYNDVEDTVFNTPYLKCLQRHHCYDSEAAVVMTETYKVLPNGYPRFVERVTHVTDTPGLFYMENSTDTRHYDKFELRVIDTDYETFGLFAACAINYKLNKKYFTTGIESRSHVLPEGKVADVVDYFKRFLGKDVTYVPVCFEDCRARC